MPKSSKLRSLGQSKAVSVDDEAEYQAATAAAVSIDAKPLAASQSKAIKTSHDKVAAADGSKTKPINSLSKHESSPPETKKRKRTADEAMPSQSIPSSDTRASSSTKASGNPFNNDRTIYVEGLSYNATEDDIREFFSKVGTIQAVRLPRWHDSGRLRGYGHVEFEDSKHATKALELDGKRAVALNVMCDFSLN
jgi:RNA recognition motif-containing protein